VIRARSVPGSSAIAWSRAVASRRVMPASRSVARLIAPARTRAVPRSGLVPGGGAVAGLVTSGVAIARRRLGSGGFVTVRRADKAAWRVDRGRGEHPLAVSLAGLVTGPPGIPVTVLPGSHRTRVSRTRASVPRPGAPSWPVPRALRTRRAGHGIAARTRRACRRGAMPVDRPRSRVWRSGLARRCGIRPGRYRPRGWRAGRCRSVGRRPGAVRRGCVIPPARAAGDVRSRTVGSGTVGSRCGRPGIRLRALRRARGGSGQRHAERRSGRQRVSRPARLVRSPARARPGGTVRLPAPAPPRILCHSNDRKHRGR
jgi:hypothetical protein